MTILLFGDITLDITLHVPVYPEVGRDVIVHQVTILPGGSITNTALVLAHLGVPVRLIARIGQDAAGDQALTAIDKSGIDLTLVQRDCSAPTGQIFIVVSPDGERTMFSARGANALITPDSIHSDVLEGITRLHLSTYSLLTVPQRNAAEKLIQMALEQKIPVSLDIADGHAAILRPDLDSLISQIDMLYLNPEDAKALLSPAAYDENTAIVGALQQKGPERIALKLGAQGCIIARGPELYIRPSLPAHVVDTTGAGDAFAAGLLYGWYVNMPMADTAWLASALGALATTVRGAGTTLPGRKELYTFLGTLPAAADQDGWRKRLLVLLSQG